MSYGDLILPRLPTMYRALMEERQGQGAGQLGSRGFRDSDLESSRLCLSSAAQSNHDI